MKKLIAYINSLSLKDRDAFAAACGTSIGYLRKAASTKQSLRADTCVAIEKASGNSVTRKDLRPDDWQAIWPELIDAA